MGPADEYDLFSNLDLEEGLYALSHLNWIEAQTLLEKALLNSSDDDQAQNGLNAIEFWRQRLRDSVWTEGEVHVLIEDVKRYKFSDLPKEFIWKILRFIASKMSEVASYLPETIVSIFDLLYDAGLNKDAEEFIKNYLKNAPESALYLSCLAQVQWRTNNNVDANLNFIKAVIYDSASIESSRIVNQHISQLVGIYGISLLPAMMWLDKTITGFDGLRDILQSERKGDAVESLRLLHFAEEFEQRNDMANAVEYRRRLKEDFEIVFQKYLEILKARRA